VIPVCDIAPSVISACQPPMSHPDAFILAVLLTILLIKACFIFVEIIVR